MDQKEYEMLKTRAQEKYKAILLQAKATRDKDLAAVEQVWVLLKEVSGEHSSARESASTKHKTLISKVRAAVAVQGRRFTAKNVADHIHDVYGVDTQKIRVSSISSVLGRLSDKKEITVLIHGSGSSPTRYSPHPPEEMKAKK